MLSPITVRPATKDDVPAIARVHVASWHATYEGLIPQSLIDSYTVERRETQWEKHLASDEYVTYVAEKDSIVIGFAMASWGESAYGVEYMERAKLWTLYLLKEAQGLGVGRDLICAVARDIVSRGHNAMSLCVLSSNPARAFYEHLGAHYVRDHAFQIGDGTWADAEYVFADLQALTRRPTRLP